MAAWIPFFIALVWPVALGVVLLVFGKNVRSIVDSLDKRICKGAKVNLGPVSVDADANAESVPLTISNGSSPAPWNHSLPSAGGIDIGLLSGVLLEIRLNNEVAESMLGDLENLLSGEGLIPLRRLNESATGALMRHPPVPLTDQLVRLCWTYLQEITMFNRLVDSIDNPCAPENYRRARISQALTFRLRLRKSSSDLATAIIGRLQELQEDKGAECPTTRT
jgi:hypothetical protein